MIRVVMDSQLRTAIELCPQYLDLRFNKNLVPLSGIGAPIEKGSMVHRMLETYYTEKRDGAHPDDMLGRAIHTGNLFITGCEFCIAKNCIIHKDPYLGLESVTIDDAQWVLRSFQQYHERWKNDFWTPLEIEKVIGEVIYEDDNISLIWKAKVDLLVDTMEAVVSMDHKTSSRKEETLSLNNQFMGQCVLTKQNKMCINKFGFQTSLKPEEKFERQMINFSDARKIEWIKESAGYAYDYIDMVKNERYPHRFTSCQRRYGNCIFRHVCEGEPDDRLRLLQAQFKVADRVWDITND